MLYLEKIVGNEDFNVSKRHVKCACMMERAGHIKYCIKQHCHSHLFDPFLVAMIYRYQDCVIKTPSRGKPRRSKVTFTIRLTLIIQIKPFPKDCSRRLFNSFIAEFHKVESSMLTIGQTHFSSNRKFGKMIYLSAKQCRLYKYSARIHTTYYNVNQCWPSHSSSRSTLLLSYLFMFNKHWFIC